MLLTTPVQNNAYRKHIPNVAQHAEKKKDFLHVQMIRLAFAGEL